ncbi:MAG: VCBS repeat-containing protein [Planctomycetes bacterium]|nr:VCBS repeat-containing protein [Planctomycetota bacterium]
MKSIWTITTAIFFFSVVFSITAAGADVNDLSSYYGFKEIEIIKLDWGIRSLCIADFDGDGRNDIAIANNRKAKIELLLQKEEKSAEEAAVVVDEEDIDVNLLVGESRFKREAVMISQRVASLVCKDLNSDGLIDLAFYSGEPRGLYVILQKDGKGESDKAGTLSWQTRKKIKIDDGLMVSNSLVCADFNRDGANDLALAARDGLYLILQKEGGTLAEPVKYPMSSKILSLKVSDLNGDKINDLVMVTNDSEKPIHVRFGLETGQLGPEIQFFTETPLGWNLSNIDKKEGDELLIIDARSGRLVCYKYSAQSEDETEWPISFYPLVSGEGETKRDLAAGDFDGDGLPDIVISEPGSAELVLYRQKEGVGLSEPVKFPAFADIKSLSAMDINGDGKLELGVLSVKEKVIGISEFTDERLTFPKPIDIVDEPVAMELNDIDRDGSVDCVYISRDSNDIYSFRIKYGIGRVEKLEAGLEVKELKSNPDGLKVVDVDQDGLKDVLVFVKYESPVLIRQVKKDSFAVVDSRGTQASLIKEANLHSIGVGNVDGKEGSELLIAQKNFARSLVFSDGKNWSVIDQYNAKSTENNISLVSSFDIDRSGKPAILLLDGKKGQLQILKAGDNKTYRYDKEINVGTWDKASHLKMLYLPLSGDGSNNILLFDSTKFAIVVIPEGKGGATLEQQFSYETKIKDGRYGNLTVGDINSDESADIIMVDYKRNHLEILSLNEQVKPEAAMRFKIFEQKGYRDDKRGKAGIEPREMKVADITNDGKADLLTVIHDRLIIYPQD